LEEWNPTSLRELNEWKNEIMNCITELKKGRPFRVQLYRVLMQKMLNAAISEHVLTMIDEINEALNTLQNRHLGIKQNTTLSRIGCGDIRKLIGEFFSHQKTIQLNFEQRIHELTIVEKTVEKVLKRYKPRIQQFPH
jgi:hypothetical protein